MSTNDNSESEVTVDLVTIEGNAFLFNNTIYQISNISSFYSAEYEITHIHKYPFVVFILAIVSVVCAAMLWGLKNDFLLAMLIASELDSKGGIFLAGVIIPALIAIGVHDNYKPKTYTYKYGLGVMLNSGHRNVFIAENEKFIAEIVRKLYTVLANNDDNRVTINFRDESVKIENVSNSNVVAGDSSGDLYNG